MITLRRVTERASEVAAVTEHKQAKALTETRSHVLLAQCRHSRINTDAHMLLAHNCALIVINQGHI